MPIKPKLAYVANSLHPGGTERLVVEMSRAFAGEFDVSVYCLDEPGDWAELLRKCGIPVHCMWRQPGLDLLMPVRLSRAFRAEGTDIVHAHQCTAWFYSALARIGYGSPRLLLQEHGRFYPEIVKQKRRFVNRMLVCRMTHRFVAVSRDIAERLGKYEGINTADVEVVYNGVDAASMLDAAERRSRRREFGFRDADLVVGTIGRLDPIKNLPMFVEAFARTSGDCDTLRGLIIGDGPEAANIRAMIRNHGLGDRLLMSGYRSDTRQLAQCLDVFVLCSFSEGMSVALLESAAAGVPAIVTAVGGNTEVVAEGVSGWVVPSDSVGALELALKAAAADEDTRHALGRAAACRYREHFTTDAMIANYRRIYSELLQQSRRQAGRSTG